ncbi:MAG: signal peptidase I [Rhizobium sp.]|nr:MAG: signal peptidase I [Rhizobium sp.]
MINLPKRPSFAHLTPAFFLKGLLLSIPVAAIVFGVMSKLAIGIDVQNSAMATSTGHRFFVITKSPPKVERGQFIGFHSDDRVQPWFPKGALFVKRAVGLPGDTIHLTGKQVYIDGSYAGDLNSQTLARFLSKGRHEFLADGQDVVVPPAHYFVMNNHPNSFDSRYWGFISYDQIVGSAYVLF